MVEGVFRGKKMRIESACIAPFRAYASCNPTRALRYKAKRKHPMRCTAYRVLHKKLFLVFVSD